MSGFSDGFSDAIEEYNARRKDALVNACEGIPTERLERMGRRGVINELEIMRKAARDRPLTTIHLAVSPAGVSMTYPEGTPVGTLAEMLYELICRGRGDVLSGPYKPVPAPVKAAIDQVVAERERQDLQWGGPEHDDQHTPMDWCQLVFRQVGLAVHEHGKGDAAFRERMVKVAGLAVAAVECMDRKEAKEDKA